MTFSAHNKPAAAIATLKGERVLDRARKLVSILALVLVLVVIITTIPGAELAPAS
jgi:hypothetical protein